MEENILAYWREHNTFKKSVESRPADRPYRFYDGPPFITGMPHYGSLLSSIVKDAVPRYWTMRGYRVDRVWGWDCHGLPIEEKVQKKLGITSNKDIEKVGMERFVEECYSYTRSVSAEWAWYVDHVGRWVDFANAYRTMDQDYMESVLWVFKRIHEKGLLYEGKRVSLYSTALSTPISNFEVAMDDSYEEVSEPAITVKFEIKPRISTGINVLNTRGEYLLIKHTDGTWGKPGGKCEVGESSLECAKRELFEETGIRADTLTPWRTMYSFHKNQLWKEYVYELTIDDDTILTPEQGKISEVRFFPLDTISGEGMRPYDRRDLQILRGEIDAPVCMHGEKEYILAWTTTPWTIPAHMALAVNANCEYVGVLSDGAWHIVAASLVETVFRGHEYMITQRFSGSELVGLSYTPPFDYYSSYVDPTRNHRVYHADFITDTDGTGIGHEAPEFGDVDFELAREHAIHISEAMDEEGRYTHEIADLQGTFYRDANPIIMDRLQSKGLLFRKESITHRIPFCPRTHTPLVQKAQKSWFINIQKVKPDLLAKNEDINWFPDHLKHGRFAKGVESAPDWCISRTRYWGAPMPVWRSEDGSETIVAGSRDEIYELSRPLGSLTRIILVRHGRTDYNERHHFDGADKARLTEEGKAHAQELIEKLKNIHVDAIYSSPMTRCMDTISPLAETRGVSVIQERDLEEYRRPSFQDTELSGWRDVSWTDEPIAEGDEPSRALSARVSKVFEKIVREHAGKTIVICTHG